MRGRGLARLIEQGLGGTRSLPATDNCKGHNPWRYPTDSAFYLRVAFDLIPGRLAGCSGDRTYCGGNAVPIDR